MKEGPADGSAEPVRLAGTSAIRLIKCGYAMMFFAGLLVLPLAFESDFHSIEAYYAGILGGLLFLGETAGFLFVLRGSRKGKREQQHGYTSDLKVATDHPELFLVGYKTLTVISRPYEPRPRQP